MSTTTEARPAMLAFDTEVVAVERRAPSMVRVTLGGDCLRDFDGMGELGPRDLRVKLMFPSPGHPLPDLSDLSGGWYARWLAAPEHRRGWIRTYTVRAARTGGATPEIDIDFVLHEDASGHSGPGSRWAAQARPGQRLTLIGPYAGSGTYGGIEWQPPAPGSDGTVRVLLAGDETAVPAIASILQTLPEAYHGHAIVEVADSADFQGLRAPSGLEVRWLARGSRRRGELLRPAVLEAALEGLAGVGAAVGRRPAPPLSADTRAQLLEDVDVDAEILWDTGSSTPSDVATCVAGSDQGCYAWIAGEAAVVKDLRRLLVGELGFDRRRVAFMGYWREGRAES